MSLGIWQHVSMKQAWRRIPARIVAVGLAVSCGDSQARQPSGAAKDGGAAGEPFVAGATAAGGAAKDGGAAGKTLAAGATAASGAYGGSAGSQPMESGGVHEDGGARNAGQAGAAGDEGVFGAGGAGVEAGPVTAIGVGYSFACAVVHGKPRCWGNNGAGQLGNGSIAPEGSTNQALPSDVKDLGTPVSSISVGYYHACALISGSVWCWGHNKHGQLGNDSVATSPEPVNVKSLGSSVVSLSAGANHTCAQLQNTDVYCWGYNEMGQVGDNSRLDRHIPTRVLAPETGLSAIDAGEYQTCALTVVNAVGAGGEGGASSNSVVCWGQNNVDAAPMVPTAIEETRGASAVSTGGNHACVLVGNRAACWGMNHYGEIAEQTWVEASAVPVVRSELSGLSSISAGAARNCAIQNGAAYCWGMNYDGVLGDGSAAEERRSPTPVVGLDKGVTAIDAGGGSLACALANGHAYCWGYPARTPVLIQGLEF